MSKDHVVSVRFETDLLADVRKLAAQDGVNVSDWVRSAAFREAQRRNEPARVHVDFNEIDDRGRVFARRVDSDKPLALGAEAVLYDLDGNTARGHVTETTGHPGAFIEMQPGTWNAPRITGWSCEHMSITSLPGVLGSVKCYQGCEMRPVYAGQAAA